MKQYRLFFGIAALFLMVSCEKEIEFSGEVTEPVLVVNSFATPDSVITVKITESKFFLASGDDFKRVDNAIVKLFVNGIFQEELNYVSEGVYKSLFTPSPGQSLRLEVSASGLKPIETEVVMPDKITIVKIDSTITDTDKYPIPGGYYGSSEDGKYNYDTIGSYYNRNYHFTLNFKDVSEKPDFYRLVLKTKLTFESGMINESYNYFDFTDIVSGKTIQSETDIIDTETSRNQYNVFSDELFNGNEYPLKFTYIRGVMEYFPGHESTGGDDSNPVKIELFIDLQSINKSYYLYLKTLSSFSGSDSYFSEPVQIHSNIKGGIGILGGYTRNMSHIDLSF